MGSFVGLYEYKVCGKYSGKQFQSHLNWNRTKKIPFLWCPWCGVRAITADFRPNWTSVSKPCSQPRQKVAWSQALARVFLKYVQKLPGSTVKTVGGGGEGHACFIQKQTKELCNTQKQRTWWGAQTCPWSHLAERCMCHEGLSPSPVSSKHRTPPAAQVLVQTTARAWVRVKASLSTVLTPQPPAEPRTPQHHAHPPGTTRCPLPAVPSCKPASMGARVTPPGPSIPPPCTGGKRSVKPYGKYVENVDAGVSERQFLQAHTLDGSTIQRMRLSAHPGPSRPAVPPSICPQRPANPAWTPRSLTAKIC